MTPASNQDIAVLSPAGSDNSPGGRTKTKNTRIWDGRKQEFLVRKASLDAVMHAGSVVHTDVDPILEKTSENVTSAHHNESNVNSTKLSGALTQTRDPSQQNFAQSAMKGSQLEFTPGPVTKSPTQAELS